MNKEKRERTPAQLANDQKLRESAASRRAFGTPRTTRAQEQRSETRVHETEATPWIQGGSLVAPPSRPGYVQRWIRVSTKGKDDAPNVSRKFREGWKPRPADTVPASYQTARMEHGKFAGNIMVEGMLLCELPVAVNKSRAKFIRSQTDKKTQAIDADLERANKANRGPGFGEIQKSARSIPVREVRVQEESGTEAEVE